IPALSISALKELKAVTDYVGLGHTHMHYEIDNWAFNPGSIEVTNIAEYRETRGVFVVNIADDNSVEARHISEYRHRPFQRMQLYVTVFSTPEELTEAAIGLIRTSARPAEEDRPAPIIELALRGQLGFPNSRLEIKKIRDEAMQITGALHIRIKNHSVPTEYAVAPDDDVDMERDTLERRVVGDLVSRDKRFRADPLKVSETVLGAKRMALSDDEPEKIAEFIKIANTSNTSEATT
ncbi:MAG TPA: hypothetical protein VK918_04220, partial [Pyrinomonadaceae bacterium]|nr:hypothetical protein [Pyrinomonadaceae bacterium]